MPTKHGKYNRAPNWDGAGGQGASADGPHVDDEFSTDAMESNGAPAGECAIEDRPLHHLVGTRTTGVVKD